jgi:ACT domain-containing protein
VEDKELLFITVIGKDKMGIVANVAQLLYKCMINIEDITQKIMSGYFVMTMLVDMRSSPYPLEHINEELEKVGNGMGLKIQVQHENIFKAMHRI